MLPKLLACILLLALFTPSCSTKIRKLTESNLQAFSKDNSYWFIQISQGKCPQCAQQESELQEIAFTLQGIVKIGKIDKKLIPSLKIQKTPAYIFTRSDEPQNSKPYQGKFNKKDVAAFCLEQLTRFVKSREGKAGSSSSSTSSSSSSGSQKRNKQSDSQSSGPSSSVIQLNDQSFQDKVLKSSDAWLVEFYSPGCGHCRNFQPQYNKLPKLIGRRVHISRIDGSKHQKFMGKYQVKGFPTVLLFSTESKDSPIPYQGERTAQAVTQWLKTQSINEEKKEIIELTRTNYIQECNKNIVCLIFILNKKSDRSKLSFLKETMEEQTNKPIKFFFSQRLDKFQTDVMINDREGPMMVSIWDSINSYKIYNGQLSNDSLTSYLKGVFEKRGWIRYQQKLIDGLFPSSEL